MIRTIRNPPMRQPVEVLSSVGGATQSSPLVGIGAGWITRVAHRAQNVTHGRFYAGLYLQDSRGNELGTLWSGYVTTVVPVSVPNLQIGEGMGVVAKVGQTNSGIATRIVFDVDLSEDEPAGAGFVFAEPMYSGPGDKRNVSLG